MWQALIGPIVNSVGGYFTARQTAKAAKALRKDELAAAKHNAQVQRIERGDVAEASYDRIAQENARSSYIDELMIIWVFVIVTLLFIPATAPYAVAGFKTLSTQVPIFFQTVFVGAFISKLGLRFLFSGRSLFGKVVK